MIAISGIVAANLSHSDALLVDGLYSGINFLSTIIAAKISATVAQPADSRHPFGYAIYEPLYVNFRSLVLLGILVFALSGAIGKIYTYASGGQVPELIIKPIVIYSIAMVIIYFGLAYSYNRAWKKLDKSSELLAAESKAALIDGILNSAAGVGLVSSRLLVNTPLAVIVPIADSIIVVLMTVFIVRQPLQMFKGAIGEIAGNSVNEKIRTKVFTRVKGTLSERDINLLNIIVTKTGRSHTVVPYIQPENPVSAADVDEIRSQIVSDLQNELGRTDCEVIVTNQSPWGISS